MLIDELLLVKFFRFCVVGFSGVIVDFSITWIVKEKLRWNKYIANSLGFITAASSNYLLNRIWTFHSSSQTVVTEYSKFFLIALVGLVINNSIIYLFHTKGKLNFYFAKLLAIGITTIWNFFMNYFFTFNQ